MLNDSSRGGGKTSRPNKSCRNFEWIQKGGKLRTNNGYVGRGVSGKGVEE